MMLMTSMLPSSARQDADAEIGPREAGSFYFNATGTFEVLEVLRGDQARAAVNRRTDWAITTRHLATDTESTHCMVWTDSDYLICRSSRSAEEVAAR
ncbi:hypothetical protein ABT224_19945 [Streptomyces sp. NPDC001584]|uniref:hypothetical protein n=1 Tax=Streptomyces sp. NPDC001584 TaxID=3154521 RepID=UPI003326E023